MFCAEDRLFRLAAEEARRGGVRLLDELVAAAAGGERAAEVRVRLAEVAGDRVDHGLRALRPARRVEEGDAGRERGEPCADRPSRSRLIACSSGAMRQPALAQLLPVELGLLVDARPRRRPGRSCGSGSPSRIPPSYETPGTTADSAAATPWNVLWSSLSTITSQGRPRPVPSPRSSRSRGGVSVALTNRSSGRSRPSDSSASR